ncbi:rhomboid family intramembrane serine protease [Actinophytocola gossypii]|uniref:Rhomboid family intramembrane serine protease n=1 Tax=Actinophytocola gossypii TaxID=2812003 RepID=A0ABT2JBH1_9PSEU|nr:rhomboid family intramembrane serine protease [Actinophytocola gossypii]MCT2585223.1 rhomboid family intramembrane serine protease [Actinophytocola gossypii]
MSTQPFGPLDPSPPPAVRDDGSLASPLGRAVSLMVGVLALLWLVELVNALSGRELTQAGGIRARDPGSLIDIVFSPFVHGNLEHLAGNALPLFSLGFIAAVPDLRRFLLMNAVVIVVGGFGVWLFSPDNSVSVGASGLVFGYFGYLLLRGIVDRRPVDVVVSVGVALAYGYLMWHSIGFGVSNISWQGHLAGLVGGMLAAILLRRRRAAPTEPAAPPPTPS